MTTGIIIFLTASFLYAIKALIFYFGSKSSRKSINISEQTPKVSVIVPARNEENNIEECINSFLSISYPMDKFELIVVNDRSTDRTGDIIDNLSTKYDFIKPVHVIENRTHKNLQGKAGALDHGISFSTGDYILMTDADCKVNTNWISEITSYFEQESADFVASYTLIEGDLFFERMQALEWIMLHTLAAGGVGIGAPLGCFGNNVAIRKTTYDKIGGYKEIPFSVTEDLALQLAVLKSSGKISYRCSVASSIHTKPVEDIKEYIKQHHRWVVGGKALGLKGYLFVLVSFSIWVSIFYNAFNSNYDLVLAIIGLRFLGDLFIIYPALKKLKLSNLLAWMLPAEIFFMIVEIMSPFLALKKEVKWKNQVFK